MRHTIGLAATLLTLASSPAHAVVSQFDETPFQNTAADLSADPSASAGEQVVPGWIATFDGKYLVTAVGPKHVLAAKHLPSQVGATVVFDVGPNVGTYVTVSFVDDPSSDLRLWEVDGVLSAWTDLYEQSDEEDKVATIFGRGRPPGDVVEFPGILPILQPLKGWKAGSSTVSEWTWGRNVVSGTFSDPTNGPLLEIEFNRLGLPRECQLSARDSSGPWFLPDGSGAWTLAALSSAVLGPYQLPTGGPEFDGLILDYGGLILGGTLFLDFPLDFPGTAVGVRISQRLSWLQPLLDLPDGDGDGIPDAADNCSAMPNADQTDTDGDDYGNACDCDFNQTGTCNIDDFRLFLPDFSSGMDSGVGTDMDGQGTVNIDDFSYFIPGFTSGQPGPSGTAQ